MIRKTILLLPAYVDGCAPALTASTVSAAFGQPLTRTTANRHIHVHVWSNSMPEHFFPEYWFAGDPLIKPADAARFQGMGTFSPIVTLMRGPDGVWHGRRDFRLDR
jgi:hypothetical protein